MQPQNRRTINSPITDAVYPRRGKPPRKPASQKRDVSPRHGFNLAEQLDAETLRALGWNPLTRKPRGGSRKGAK